MKKSSGKIQHIMGPSPTSGSSKKPAVMENGEAHKDTPLGGVVPPKDIAPCPGSTLEGTEDPGVTALETGEGGANPSEGKNDVFFTNDEYKYELSIGDLRRSAYLNGTPQALRVFCVLDFDERIGVCIYIESLREAQLISSDNNREAINVPIN